MTLCPQVYAAWRAECCKADIELDVKRPYQRLEATDKPRYLVYQQRYRERHHKEILAKQRAARAKKKPLPGGNRKTAQMKFTYKNNSLKERICQWQIV